MIFLLKNEVRSNDELLIVAFAIVFLRVLLEIIDGIIFCIKTIYAWIVQEPDKEVESVPSPSVLKRVLTILPRRRTNYLETLSPEEMDRFLNEK